MFRSSFFGQFFGPRDSNGTEGGELILGSVVGDIIDARGGDDTVRGFGGNDFIIGGTGNDDLDGGSGEDTMQGGDGIDEMRGGSGDDEMVAGKGNDRVFGESGNDLMVWNNGDGSDLFDGGTGDDTVQVNFNTDLVNDDLQNDDTARIEDSAEGVAFARTELNGQSVNGLFELDIRNTETLETNFGGGDDTAEIEGGVLDAIKLELDGGDGIDTLDLSKVNRGLVVDLHDGTVGDDHATNFENVIGTEFNDTITGNDEANVISGLGGADTIFGKGGNDTIIA
ncbi:MAG: calcium-binding protein, partial [Pseudomonadota bacterium]